MGLKVSLLAAFAGVLASTSAFAQDWKPSEPVNVVVPWGAGGSTDTITRVVASEVAKALGQSVVILNQPGASGAVGTRSVWEAKHDGLTLAAGAAADLGAYSALGTLDVPLDQWRMYLHIANPALISVRADSPYQTFAELLEALKTQELTVSSGGNSSSTAITMQALEKAEPSIKYRPIVYEGGAPAVISTVSGETQFTATTASEQVDMILAKRLRPLAVVATQPIEVQGFGTIPAITDTVPTIATAPNYFGIFLPADAPAEVAATLDKIWAENIVNSEAIKTYAAERGSMFNPTFGEAAVEAAMPFISINAWQQFDAGTAPNEPAQYGIPRP